MPSDELLRSRNVGGSGRTVDMALQLGAPAPPNQLTPLCAYYLECLNEGDGGGLSVYTSSFNKLDYVELGAMPGAEDSQSAFEKPAVRALIERCRLPRERLSLRLGMPVLIVQRRGKTGEYFKLEPILLWLVDPTEAGQGFGACMKELPFLNFDALHSLIGSKSEALEELFLLNRELGLESESAIQPDIGELLGRLRTLRPTWPWAEPTDVGCKITGPPASQIKHTGILNRAILAAVPDSPYTKGLREELSLLRALPICPPDSALATWLKAPHVDEGQVEIGDLLEPVPLNDEQREAVARALVKPLTVITGPPGTGKSQVVSTILINAALRGMRVLFSSKNNQAVDVVEVRVNALGDRPVLLRLGGKAAFFSRLNDYISKLLGTRAGPVERQALEQSRKALDALKIRRRQVASTRDNLVQKRNQVDGLDLEVQRAREVFGTQFGDLRGFQADVAETELRALSRLCERATRSKAFFLIRPFWRLLRASRFEALAGTLQRLASGQTGSGPSIASVLQLPEPGMSLTDDSIIALSDRIQDASARLGLGRKVIRYWKGLEELQSLPDLGSIDEEESRLLEEVLETSLDFWRAWVAVKPAELSAADRQLLSDYQAVLHLLASGSAADRSIWSKFFVLSEKVVRVLSCWAVTSLSAKGRLPFAPGTFDLLIVDEASQCDIASALPLLFRAKRTVIIGDPLQLRHISSLTGARDQQLLRKHDLIENRLSWSYSAKSLFDLAAGMSAPVVLKDHHRSHPDIIGFSNEEFYGRQLRVATKLDQLKRPFKDGPSIRWIDIQGHATRPTDGGLINEEEAKSVVKELRRLVLEQRYAGTIGVTSPFRAQVNRIRDLTSQDRDLQSALERADFVVDSVHRFQGDERDVILFSPTISSGPTSKALGFLGSQPNIFNVAVTRARAALIIVGDRAAAQTSEVKYLTKCVEYVDRLNRQRPLPPMKVGDFGPEYPPVSPHAKVSDWEIVLYRGMFRAGLRPLPQYSEDKYVLDFALLEGERRLNIEVDGEMYHRAWDGELILRDRLRNLRLIELGWDILRFWVYEVRDDLPGCVRRIRAWVEKCRKP